eukprot:INCI19038.3.p1 GENE.INCI19038.3~~INCI19038.3.p1  ORF type:complete len:303 (+),score=31.48 INCI19038.3:366-1274(+)
MGSAYTSHALLIWAIFVASLLRPRGCKAQIEGSDLEWVNSTLCATGYYFNKTGCVCSKIRLQCPNDCNGHGACDYATGVCTCDDGWGSSSDVSDYKSLDCSLRTCPSGISWSGVPTSAITARTRRECSGVGICNKLSGECKCSGLFFGDACEYSGCPNSCSGHGRCVNNFEVCEEPSVEPVGQTTNVTYGLVTSDEAWDSARIFGCVCDSSWSVGTGNGELQRSEYYGGDCSLRRCPSGDDPITDVDETDCEGVGGGEVGNLCYVPCSNRGTCDAETGVCSCNVGFAGDACNTMLSSTTRRY